MEKSYNQYKKGSEWRKWDLHLHTPYTNLNRYKATDTEFIKKIKNAEISVVALTNYYYFRDEEFSLKAKLESEGIAVFFNLELRTSYTNAQDKCCDIHVIFSDEVTKEDLNALLTKLELNLRGSKVMATKLQQSDLTLATVDFWHLYETLNNEALNLKGKHFIGFLSRGHGNGRTSSNYETLYEKCDFLLHSSDKQEKLDEDRKFWLKNGRALYQSSDAHDIDTVGTKFSWVKADPTFEGLKQVIYEPEERIKLQPHKPDEKASYQVIDSLTLDGEGLWAGQIQFNENLNAIIGGRSTGKSSLLASIAHKLGKFSTLNAKYEHYVVSNSSSVTLNWKDGKTANERDVDYFPQSFMHTLARVDSQRNELIEDIVRKKDQNCLLEDYSNFIATQKTQQESLISNLFSIQEQIKQLKVSLSELGDNVGIEIEIGRLKGELSKLNSDFSEPERKEYDEINTKLSKLNENLRKGQTYTTELHAVKKHNFFNTVDMTELISYEKFQTEFSEKHEELKQEFEKQWDNFATETIRSIADKMNGLKEESANLATNPIYIKGKKQLKDNLVANELNAKVRVEENKLQNIKQKYSELTKKQESMSTLIEKIALSHREYKDKASQLSSDLKFKESDLEVTVCCKFDEDRVKNILTEQLAQRSNEQKDIVSEHCEQYPIEPEKAVTKLIELAISGKLQCKGSHTPQSVLTQVISTNTYQQNYELTYQNDSFDQMSQGKQAFVVLKLLLEFSDKTCPVLIDQPEDSLDNRAIYNELVKYLKLKKKDRQIILVTHNPNVVVSADAEQIIVANQHDAKSKNEHDLKFQYISGGIEHSIEKNHNSDVYLKSQGIRQHICEVLEGGNEAFKKREQKYQLSR
ncbi:TrlF family AAA-like ATPase [Aliivibrio salmonicida]|uniref:TrlF family AAA-like ATPase n=1 Tax=Aliivibrio salmonicida TaxID=40269 RepID=UPI00406C6C6B